MKRRHKRKPSGHRKIARERIKELFEEAELRYSDRPDLSDRYVELARKIAMRYRTGITKELKKKFCKHCYKFLMPGDNCRIRLKDRKVVYYCRNCRKFMRFPLS